MPPRRTSTSAPDSSFEQPFRRPGNHLMWSEQWRAGRDLLAYWAALPSLATGTRGDGHTVFVVPGFLADDTSTIGLHTVLAARGYRPAAWHLGPNIGPSRRIMDGLTTRLHHLYAESGRPVSLVGQSLGGILARELARQSPERVRAVVTLGSPFRLTTAHDPDLTSLGWVYETLRPWHSDVLDGRPSEETRSPLPMPATAIYSKLDGVVPWQSCLELSGPHSESVEVAASHCGMGFHPQALSIVLDRLGQPEDAWRPYAEAVAG